VSRVGTFARLGLFVRLARPAVLVLFALSAALGVAQAGHALDLEPLAHALLVVVPFVVYGVAVNDISDVAVDRINLPDAADRPLATGSTDLLRMRRVAAISGLAALAAAASVGRECLLVTIAGLVVATAYSTPPLRFSARGIVGPLMLPLGFLAVPFLTGILATGSTVGPDDLAVLLALYLGFIGRLLLKDFRDVRGDSLLGKRTFLVRRGRGWTCALSSVLFLAGTAVLAFLPASPPVLVAAYLVLVATAVALVAALARSRSPHRDERLISAVAIAGRGLLLVLLVHYGALATGASALREALLVGLATAVMLFWTFDVARNGVATSSLAVPASAQRETPRTG
jgi:4-hydroxybenzoate polyprenyltransferase